MHQWRCSILNENFNACSQGSIWQEVIIGLGNGLVPNRQQAITWNSGDTVTHAYVSLSGKLCKRKQEFAYYAHLQCGPTKPL